jgi:hypothetical protein
VREKIDAVSTHLQGYREVGYNSVGAVFLTSPYLAIGVLVINVALYGLIRKNLTGNQYSSS